MDTSVVVSTAYSYAMCAPYVQTLYKRSFECMTLELAHDHLKRVLPERSILSCASMSCSDGYILLLSNVDVMKKQCA